MLESCRGEMSFESIRRCKSKYRLRKLILCALGMSDPSKARDVYFEMSDSNKKDPSTQYLLYKVALRSQDPELGDLPFCTCMYLTDDDKLPSALTLSAAI